MEDYANKLDQMLYETIPKPIADQLRDGESLLKTLKHDSVSILFTHIVDFNTMCFRLPANELAHVVNSLFVAYDKLCDKHLVYKVGEDGWVILAHYVCKSIVMPCSLHLSTSV